MNARYARWSAGTLFRIAFVVGENAKSRLGTTHGAVRWKTVRCATSGWIAGTNWIALAPVPITATRLPRSSTE